MARYEGFKLIGRIDDDYYFVNSVFDHGFGFKGVTGCIVRPVSETEWEWASDRENIAERYADVFDEYDGEESFDKWLDSAIQYAGIAHLMFDESYCCDAEPIFNELGIDYECTDCISGGRIFHDLNFDEIYDSAAYTALMCCEGYKLGAKSAANVIFNSWRQL